MDTIEEITLSKIAAILTKDTIFKVSNNSVWERILSISGQSKLFELYQNKLRPFYYNGTWENRDPEYSGCYSAVNQILKTVYLNSPTLEELYLLFESIIKEFEIRLILSEKYMEDTYYFYSSEREIKKMLEELSNEDALELILANAKKDFLDLHKSSQILNLDLVIENGELCLKPFTLQGANELERKGSTILDWLNVKNPKVANLYVEALENYINGKVVSCISNCRNIILGICEDDKDDDTKWLKGLQKISTDTYIQNVNVPKNIIDNTANKSLGIKNVEFKFARFKLVYYLYSLASDLGPHATEGPMLDGVLYTENTTMADALWILRMTEDFLLWYKQSKSLEVEVQFDF